MKPDEQNKFPNSQFFDLLSNHPQESSYLSNSTCKGGNPCEYLCISQHCESIAAICNDVGCECRSVHNTEKLCSMCPLKAIVSKTEKIKQSFPYALEWLNQKFDKLIDWISDEREKLEQRIKSLGLNEDQRQFLKAVYEGYCNKLTGKQMYEIVNDANLESRRIRKMIANDQHQLSEDWKKCVETIEKEVVSISQKIKMTCVQESVVDGLKSSKVLETQIERGTVAEMLEQNNRKILQYVLLYRASDNNFDIRKFWDKCDKKANTVTVARTNYNKVIGGYTPLSWKKNYTYWEHDVTRESFVFSVTEKTKFKIKEKMPNFAIHYDPNYGPYFGHGADLCIGNCVSNIDSWSNVGFAYENDKFEYNTKETWEFFHGSKTSQNFVTQEWEVWQVIFEEKKNKVDLKVGTDDSCGSKRYRFTTVRTNQMTNDENQGKELLVLERII